MQHSNGIISIRVYLPIEDMLTITEDELEGGNEEGKTYRFFSLSVSIFILIKIQVAKS